MTTVMSREVLLIELKDYNDFLKLVNKVKKKYKVVRIDYENLVIEFYRDNEKMKKKVKIVCGLINHY